MSYVAFNEVQGQTYFALGHAAVLEPDPNWKWPFAAISILVSLRSLVRRLRLLDVESCDENEIQGLVRQLADLKARISSIIAQAERVKLTEKVLYRFYFQKLRAALEDVDDFYENLVVFLDKDLHSTLSAAVAALKKAETPVPWRSSLAKMRD